MTAKELREKYLQFFKEKGHAVIPGASLIPEHDPTVLFTTAGMHPLVLFLLGEKHPAGQRLVDVQKCVRTGDIDSVGDSWHLTFFEMLGNWSLGSYWKEEAISWSFEFLTSKKWLGIPAKKLNVTIFAGDKDTAKDEESARIWQSLGISQERIFYLPKEDNWWGPAGQTGPCGPCTEMFYDTGKDKCGKDCQPGCDCGKYAEIWNDVFMAYNKTSEGKFQPLKQKNIDTGMGIERTVAVLNGFDNVYQTELFEPIIKEIKSLAKILEPNESFQELYNPAQAMVKKIAGLREKAEKEKATRIIADHLKAATFILAENIEPSNVEQGYVLRRLIRRAVCYGRQLGIIEIFAHKIAQIVINVYKDIYPEILREKEFIQEQLVREEEKFSKTLERGLKKFEEYYQSGIIHNGKYGNLPKRMRGRILFELVTTYGFPLELIKEIARERNRELDIDDFNELMERHRELSRVGAEQKFKGGLADHSEQTTKYHTTTHLMLAALRRVLGEHVAQRGSNITEERIRFDFSHNQKMTPEQIKEVEGLVNQKIKENFLVDCKEMLLDEAKKEGAMGVFEKKYGEKVKVYTIYNPQNKEIFSKEICGGPHAEKTGVLGKFKIIKEEASSAGVRRIKAVLE